MEGALSVLKQYFGYDSFRKGQTEIVEQIISGHDVLGIMPTGAGKSICFQVPALMMEGITLVISPLISLMTDQVQALVQAGVPAAYLNSSLTIGQQRKVLQNIQAGKYKLVYIAPERLLADDFAEVVQTIKIAMVTVDEAHCLSQWGQNFRPNYLKIIEFITTLANRPIVSAFTATATAQVRDDIYKQLQLQDAYVLTTGFDRPNLTFTVRKPKNKMLALQEILQLHADESGIIYCSTRKNVEEVHAFIQQQGIEVARYHAGLADAERKLNQEDFLYDRVRIMVATNAFGMGIDKSNVSFVVHFNMPKNIENYYQEAGRAGRDGQPAECFLLYSGQDVITNQFLIDHAEENEELDKETMLAIKQKDRELLKQMTFYCHTMDCLRAYILRYFGEKADNYCGNCGNCNENFETVDVTVEAQKILSCVKRLNERFGVKMIVDTLRGKNTQRIVQLRLDKQATYGILATDSESRVRDIINHLQLHGYIRTTEDEYPVLALTPSAIDVLRGETTLIMKIVREEERVLKAKNGKASTKKSKSDRSGAHPHQELFAKLKQLRSKLAQEQEVPAFVVFSDATLHDMCARLPKTQLEFLDVSGVGHAKLTKYGDEFLEVILLYCEEHAL